MIRSSGTKKGIDLQWLTNSICNDLQFYFNSDIFFINIGKTQYNNITVKQQQKRIESATDRKLILPVPKCEGVTPIRIEKQKENNRKDPTKQ